MNALTSESGAHRTLVRNQHRVVAAYLSLYCWRTDCDALIVPREFFEKALMLQRFREARLEQIRDDFAGYFKFRKKLVYSGASKFATLLLSRKKLTDIGPAMSDNARAKYLSERGTPTRVVSNHQDHADFSFETLATVLMAVTAGLKDASEIPNLRTASP